MYLRNLTIATSIFFNALTQGDSYEQYAARVHRMASKTGRKRWTRTERFIDFLFGKNHCRNVWQSEHPLTPAVKPEAEEYPR